MPNCTGSMPKDWTTGRKIGVQIRISAAMSMIMPSISSITLIIKRRAIGFSEMPVMTRIIRDGT